jgi:hypothetical protein
MPKQGKRAAASKKNGALGGRSSGPAGGHPTADAPQGAAALVAPSKEEADRPRNKPSAVPLVRRDPDRICLEDAALFGHGESPGDRPPAPRAFFEPEGRKSRAGQKRKQLPEQGQIKQGKGKQRGSLLADCLERAETECAEALAGLDQGSSACESTRHDNWIPADWLICCFLFFGQWMGMQLQPNQDQESRAQSRISFAVPLPLQHRHHQRPHQNRRSPPPQALLLP